MIPESTIKLAAKLYEARNTMKALHGEGYPALIKQFQGFIKSEMDQKKCSELEAATNIVKDLQLNRPESGMTQVLILAAVTELIEPSESLNPESLNPES